MSTVLVPINAGFIKNFMLYGEGGWFDNATCIFYQGYFVDGALTGNECCITRYSSPTVIIRHGQYANNAENGNITEYTFPSSYWGTFITFPDDGVDATKINKVFTNGVLDSESVAIPVKIKGSIILNIRASIAGFSFTEV